MKYFTKSGNNLAGVGLQKKNKCLNLYIPIFIFAFFLFAFESKAAPIEAEKKIIIVIDPGHGGDNLGTIECGYQEKDMTLTTAFAMYEELSLFDNVEVFLTREDDSDLSLKERAEIAKNHQADFLYSLHYNASLSHTIFGSEVWVSLLPKFNGKSYQFAYIHQQTMQEMGLFSRGIKTRENDEKKDYYGIIRESVERNIPVALIEHCHVDQEIDQNFCDTDEKLRALGKADAHSVAKYFGLKSTYLQLDYHKEADNLVQIPKNEVLGNTLFDETPPDICMVELVKELPQECYFEVNVTATDYDTPLLYYCYSLDGGDTYTQLYEWPGSNALTGEYADSFILPIKVPEGTIPSFVFKAYNLFDASTESNIIEFKKVFQYPPAMEEVQPTYIKDTDTETDETTKEKGVVSFLPVISRNETQDKEVSIFAFIMICILIVLLLFSVLFISVFVTYIQKQKRRKKRKHNKDRLGN